MYVWKVFRNVGQITNDIVWSKQVIIAFLYCLSIRHYLDNRRSRLETDSLLVKANTERKFE